MAGGRGRQERAGPRAGPPATCAGAAGPRPDGRGLPFQTAAGALPSGAPLLRASSRVLPSEVPARPGPV